jgi:hypothetical protein
VGTEPTLAEAMRALRTAEPPGGSPHPSLEEMVAHHEGRLARDAADAFEDHLVQCRGCTERSIELARFLAPESSKPQERARPRAPRPLQRPRLLQQLAAVLLVTTTASTLAWLSTRAQLLRQEAGDVNVPVVEIDAGLRRRVEAAKQPPQTVSPRAVLIVTPLVEAVNGDHEVVISSADGRPVWSARGLRPTANGSFQLRLPQGLEPGRTYRIQIFPGDAQGFPIRIAPSAPG